MEAEDGAEVDIPNQEVDEDYITEDEEDAELLEEVENTHYQLVELLDECNEMVTNIEVASNIREINQRKMDDLLNKTRMEYLEEENVKAQQQFEEITSQWEPAEKYKDCLEIYNACEEQKRRCEELLRSKDRVIDVLKKELAEADEKFISNGKLYQDDINLLSDRIDRSIEIMRDAYSKHIQLIEELADKQQSLLIDKYHDKWMDLYNEYQKKQEDDTQERFKLVEEYESDMEKMYFEFQEKYRFTKDTLENELHNLQVAFQEAEHQYMMSEKKLEYNYMVLTEREEELTVILSDQKRRLNRLRKIYSDLREKIQTSQKEYEANIARRENEISKIKLSMKEYTRKMKRLQEVNEISFIKAWKYHEKRMSAAVEKLWKMEKLLHEKVLGIPWQKPDFQPMKITDLPSVQAALRELNDTTENQPDHTLPQIHANSRLTNFILDQIVKNLEFLCAQLNNFVSGLPAEKKTVLNYEYVLKILNVHNPLEMEKLEKYFVPHITCVTCKERKDKLSRPRPRSGSKLTKLTVRFRPSSAPLTSDKDSDKSDIESSRKLCTNPYHSWFIDRFKVINAVTRFIEERAQKKKKEKSKPTQKKVYLSKTLTMKDIQMYFQHFQTALSEESDLFWDTFEGDLKKYTKLVKDNEVAEKEIAELENENNELNRLLRYGKRGRK